MSTRLKALARRVAALEGKELPPDVQAALQQLEALLPPVRRGRPKQPNADFLCWLVRISKGLGGHKTDKALLQRFARSFGVSVKRLQNRLAEARKAPK